MEQPGTFPSFLKELVDPWYSALENPEAAQQATFSSLVKGYATTEYGLWDRHSSTSAAWCWRIRYSQ